jgi:HlyD family secretion protein
LLKNWRKVGFKFKLPRWLVGIFAIALVAGGGYVVYAQMNPAPKEAGKRRGQSVTVERTTLPITITANGTVQPEQSVNVSPKAAGILKRLLVKEGDRVEAGQILAEMDDANLQGQLISAQGQLASAQANLDKLVAGSRPQEIAQAEARLAAAQANLDKVLAGNRSQDIAQAQAQLISAQVDLQQAELTFNRNQQLTSAGAISQQQLDTSRTAYNTAKARVDQLTQALNLQQTGTRPEEITAARAQVEELKQVVSLQKTGTRSEEIDAARAQVMAAQGQLTTVQTLINDTVIRAPFTGVITRKFADPGAFVTPTTSSSAVSSATSSSILAIAAKNQIVAKVAETSIPQIKVGLQVTIEADAYPGKSFAGQVTQVATQSTVEQNVTNFEVKSNVVDPQRELQAGMNVTVKFIAGTLDNALVIPTVAIVRQEQGTGVYVAGKGESEKPKFQPIATGISVEDKTVVSSGLEVGDRVLLSFPKGERPISRTPSVFPGVGGPSGGGSGGSSGGRRSRGN